MIRDGVDELIAALATLPEPDVGALISRGSDGRWYCTVWRGERESAASFLTPGEAIERAWIELGRLERES